MTRLEGMVASLLLAVAAWSAGRMLWRRVRVLAAAGLEAACLPGADQVVIMPDDAVEAYALPGLPGRVVVSTAMLDALDPDERDVLLAHERAHLTGHHYAFIAAGQLAAAANPLVRPLSDAIRYSVERWADEHAARVCGDRRRVALAVGKAALAARRTPRGTHRPGAALGLFGLRHDPLRQAGPLPRRVQALLTPAPAAGPARTLIAIPSAGTVTVVALSMLCALATAHHLHELIEVAQRH